MSTELEMTSDARQKMCEFMLRHVTYNAIFWHNKLPPPLILSCIRLDFISSSVDTLIADKLAISSSNTEKTLSFVKIS